MRRYRAGLDQRFAELREWLLTGERPYGEASAFRVRDPKPRLITAPTFRVRVFHHALMEPVIPLLEACAIGDSYACREGKGVHRAIERVHRFARRGGWHLRLDVARFFDSVPHAGLLGALGRRIADRAVLAHFERVLSAHAVVPGRGLPIGSLTSQHLANHYLTRADHHLRQQLGVRAHVRYMDDFLIFVPDRAAGRRVWRSFESWLSAALGLRFKPPLALAPVAGGLTFLGFRIERGEIRLAARSAQRVRRRLRDQARAVAAGALSPAEAEQRRAAVLSHFTRARASAVIRTATRQARGRG